MSVNDTRPDIAYAISTPLLKVFSPPIITKRNPTIGDRAPTGTVWVNTVLQTVYIVAGVTSGSTNWVSYSTQTGSFHSITVDTGNITVSVGNIIATAGSIAAGTNVTAGGSISAVDNVTAGNAVSGVGIVALDDLGVGTSGTITFTAFVDDNQSTGDLTIVSKSANSGTNTGFLKIYAGTTIAYIPYFETIAP